MALPPWMTSIALAWWTLLHWTPGTCLLKARMISFHLTIVWGLGSLSYGRSLGCSLPTSCAGFYYVYKLNCDFYQWNGVSDWWPVGWTLGLVDIMSGWLLICVAPLRACRSFLMQMRQRQQGHFSRAKQRLPRCRFVQPCVDLKTWPLGANQSMQTNQATHPVTISWCYPKAMTEGISLHLDSFFPSISIKGFQSKFKITATVKSQSKTFRNVRNYIEYQQGLTSSTNWCARLKILLSCKISKKPFTSSTKHAWASSCLGLACWGKHFLSLFFPGRWKFLAHATLGSSLPPRIFFP